MAGSVAAELLAEEGVEAAQAGDYASAALSFERSLACRDDATVRCNLGVAYERLGRLEEAIDAYGAAGAAEASDPVALVNRGDALVRAGRVRDATRCYVDALARSPAEPWAVINNLGVAYERSGELENAVLAYREAARLAPRYARPRENLRRIYAERPGALGAALLPPGRDESRRSATAEPSFVDAWLACSCICAPSPAASPTRADAPARFAPAPCAPTL